MKAQEKKSIQFTREMGRNETPEWERAQIRERKPIGQDKNQKRFKP
jgi:hypothetical protein